MVRTEWDGVLAGRRHDRASLQVQVVFNAAGNGGSRPFLVLGSDNRQYWVKALNNPQSPRVPVNEQIVGRVGALIGAPVCGASIIRIPATIAGWQVTPGYVLAEGLAHASLAEEPVTQIGALQYRTDDDNVTRHVAILALSDLCWGEDLQWLVKSSDENRYFSHDHGYYFPQGPNWTRADLEANVDVAHELADNGAHITLAAARSVANAVESVTREALANAIAGVPQSWLVSDEELETIGYFIEERASQVAARIRVRFGV
jgi:hypothetical protein